MAFLSWCAHRLALRFFFVQLLALLTTLFTSLSLRSSCDMLSEITT